jgi:hypothetical protein
VEPTGITNSPQDRLTTMGTISERTRKDGSRAYMAQIVIKKDGKIVHREAETFDRRQAANAWVVKRESELKKPGGLQRKEDPILADVIDRFIAESKNIVLGTKAQVLRTIKNSDLGDLKCSDITSQTLVSFGKALTRNVEPQTCGNYFSHLSNILTVARPAWGYPLNRQEFEDAVTVLKKLGLIRKGIERQEAAKYRQWAKAISFDHPHTAKALDTLAEHYEDLARRHDEDTERLDWQ